MILSDIYSGKFSVESFSPAMTLPFKQALTETDRLTEMLNCHLNAEDQKLLEQLIHASSVQANEQAKQSFIMGVRFGMKLLIEIDGSEERSL